MTSSLGTPTGTVTFAVGTTPLCIAVLSNDEASCTVASAPPGADQITATYSGDTSFVAGSADTTLDVVPMPSAPPAGSTGSASGTSTSVNGTATASIGTLTVHAEGLGSVTVASYGANPTGANSPAVDRRLRRRRGGPW